MPRRFGWDWIVLPVVALATAAACLAGLEGAARILLPQQLGETCQTPSGAFPAGCVLRMKAAEGPWTTAAFNACGSRSLHPCDALPAGNRVVVVGTSISRGYAVAYPKMFAPRAEAILDRACAAPAEFQELSVRMPTTPDSPVWAAAPQAAKAAAALHPKAILLFVAPWDLFQYHEGATVPPRRGWKRTAVFKVLSGMADKVRQAREDSRFVLAMRHFLNRRDQVFVDSYMRKGDETDYVRPSLSPAWKSRIPMVVRFAEPIAAEAARAGIPFALVYIPAETDVLLARGTAVEPHTDPFTLPRALQAAAAERGWGFIDALPAFAAPDAPQPEFYRINGHPNAFGHAAIARALAGALLRDRSVCRQAPAPGLTKTGPTPVSDREGLALRIEK